MRVIQTLQIVLDGLRAREHDRSDISRGRWPEPDDVDQGVKRVEAARAGEQVDDRPPSGGVSLLDAAQAVFHHPVQITVPFEL
jgi:hypothetical protein